MNCVTSPISTNRSATTAITALGSTTLISNFSEISSLSFKNSKTGVWQRIINWWRNAQPLDYEIDHLTTLLKNDQDQLIQNKLLAITKVLHKHANKRAYHKTTLRLRALFTNLSDTQLNQFLFSAAQAPDDKNGRLLDTCLNLLSFERMSKLIAHKHQEIEGITNKLSQLQQLAADAIRFLPINPRRTDKAAEELSRQTSGALVWMSNFGQTFFDTCMKAYKISPDDPPPEHSWEARQRLDNMFTMFEKPIAIFGWLTATLAVLSPINWMPYVIASTAMLLSVIGLKVYDLYYNTVPLNLSNDFPDLIRLAKNGEIDPVIGRQKEIQEVLNCLGELDKHSRKPLLIGKSGCGKTEIVKGLALAIANGEHPHLKGKALFSINTAALMQIGGGGPSGYRSRLEKLVKDIKGKEDNVILFFDEIHTLLKHREGSISLGDLSQEFKTLLDNPKIHCIAATTQAEYEQSIKTDDALNRRFRPIEVGELPRESCRQLLIGIANRDFPNVVLSEEAINFALDITERLSPAVAQPAKAKDLLIEAIQSIRKYSGPVDIELSSTIDALTAKKMILNQEKELLPFSDKVNDKLKELTQLADKVDRLKKIINDKNNEIRKLESIRQEGRLCKERCVKLAQELGSLDIKKSKEKAEQLGKQLLALAEYRIQSIKQRIADQERKLTNLNIPTCVSPEVVKSIWESRKA